jgi:hypothetical protein
MKNRSTITNLILEYASFVLNSIGDGNQVDYHLYGSSASSTVAG